MRRRSPESMSVRGVSAHRHNKLPGISEEMMYAIIRAGGKQSKVSEGDVLDVERLKETGEVTFTPLLIVKDDGTVISDAKKLEKAKVTVEVMGEHRGNKVEVFKYKNKTGYRRSAGHRQTYTTVKVKKITMTGAKKAASKAAAKKDAAAAEEK
jgi:large subunit ribosomal protein L21